MKPLRWVSVIALVAALALTATVAYAHTVVFPTRITIKVSDHRISLGDSVRFSGHLRSPKARCESHSTVDLVRVGAGVKATTKTHANGKYVFRIKPTKTGRWRVRFPGKVLTAVHPHNHTCAASHSDTVRVRVR